MAVERTVYSPDGRSWRLERVRPDFALAGWRNEPFLWASVAATVMLVALAVWMAVRDRSPMYFVVAAVLFGIWLLERGLNPFRPNIRAQTDGPPAETLTWRTTHLFAAGRTENKIAKEIRCGRTEAEPSGAVLIGI